MRIDTPATEDWLKRHPPGLFRDPDLVPIPHPPPPPKRLSLEEQVAVLNPGKENGKAKVIKHYPGGQDHDQSTHGRRGSQAPPDTSYRGSHQPSPTYGAPAHDLSVIVSEDIYTHPEWYFSMSEPYNRVAARILARIRGNPDAQVTIYRAVPKGVSEINPGDWVTIVPSYARLHGESSSYDIIERTVPARDLVWPADSLVEFGWFPGNRVEELMAEDEESAKVSKRLTLADQVSVVKGLWDRVVKHYPGGKDHDQKRHGRRGPGSPTLTLERAKLPENLIHSPFTEGRGKPSYGPPPPPPDPPPLSDPHPASVYESWGKKDPDTGLVFLQPYQSRNSATGFCADCGRPAWEIPPDERGRFGNPPGAVFTHIGKWESPRRANGSNDRTLVVRQADEGGESFWHEFQRSDGSTHIEEWIVVDHRPSRLIEQWSDEARPMMERLSEYEKTEDKHSDALLERLRQDKERGKGHYFDTVSVQTRTGEKISMTELLARGRQVRHEVEDALVGKADPAVSRWSRFSILSEMNLEGYKAAKAREVEASLDAAAFADHLGHGMVLKHGLDQTFSKNTDFLAAMKYPGFTVSENLAALDDFLEGKPPPPSAPFEVPLTKGQYAYFADLSDSEEMHELKQRGLRFDKTTLILPNRQVAMQLGRRLSFDADYAMGGSKKMLTSLANTISESLPPADQRWEFFKKRFKASEGGSHDPLLYIEEGFYPGPGEPADKPSSTPYTGLGDRAARDLFVSKIRLVEDREVVSGTFRASDLISRSAAHLERTLERQRVATDELKAIRDPLLKELTALQSEHEDTVRQVLSRHREFGSPGTLKFARRSKHSAEVDRASTFLPKDWADAIAENVPKMKVSAKARGHFSPWEQEIKLDGSSGVAVHELGHAAESYVPALNRAEQAFYEWRVQHSESTNMARESPGRRYSSSERTWPDNFADPYMGKRYSPHGSWAGGFELISMGLQQVYTMDRASRPADYREGGFTIAQRVGGQHPLSHSGRSIDYLPGWGMDEEMADFIFGLLTEV
jgi:hypothetical protein